MSDLRTSIILNMTGNVGAQSRRFGRDIDGIGRRGTALLHSMNRGLDRLGNRYAALLSGAALGGAVKMVGDIEERFVYLGNKTGKTREEMARLRGEIYAISRLPDIRLDPDQLVEAISEVVERTGDLDFATDNLKNFAAAIKATNAQGGAIGGIAAEFQKMGMVDPKDVLLGLDTLIKQGDAGAFTLEKLAALAPRIFPAYAARGRSGLEAVREVGAALQIIQQGTGSPEQATTAFEAIMRVLGDTEKLKKLNRRGVQVFDPEQAKKGLEVIRPINEIMVEIIKNTKGKGTLISSVIGDASAMQALAAAAAEFTRTGGFESLNKFMNVDADGSKLLKDSANAAGTFNSALTYLRTTTRKFADDNLSDPVKSLADGINSIEPDKVDQWLKVGKWVFGAGAGLVATRKITRLFGRRNPLAGGGGGMGLPGADGPVPVYVVNNQMSLLNNGAGFGAGALTAGTAGAAAGGTTAFGTAIGLAIAPAVTAGLLAWGSEKAGKAIGRYQVGGMTTQELNELVKRSEVMGGGSPAGRAELDRRDAEIRDMIDRGMRGELNIKIDSPVPVSVSGMRADGMDMTVDTGRIMGGQR